MNYGWLVLAVLVVVDDPVHYFAQDRADLIEVNHYADSNGKPVLNQMIFYDWNASAARLEICDYKLLRSGLHEPNAGFGCGDYFSIWQDDQGIRVLSGRSEIETWTQVDPENWQRRLLPADQRRGLSRR